MIEKPHVERKGNRFDDVESAAEGLKNRITKAGGTIKERANIYSDGSLKLDAKHNALFAFLGEKSVESLMLLAQKVQQRYPDFEFSFNQDPARQWIEYSVSFKRSTR